MAGFRYGVAEYDSRTGDDKTRPKNWAGSLHGKSVQAPIRFVILHSVYIRPTLSIDSRPRVNERLVPIQIV